MLAAVVGGAYGGGMEILLNCDMVVTEEKAKFALPEVKRGVHAVQGGEFRDSILSLVFSFFLGGEALLGFPARSG